MAYTEVKQKDKKRYYYRVRSVRKDKKFKKERIYLGKNIPKKELSLKEIEADKKLNIINKLKGLEKIKPEIIKVLKKYKIKKAGIFGSYSRGEENKNSDVDILVEPPKGIGFGFAGIQFELEDKLGKKVDLVTYRYIHPTLKKDILAEEVRII
jgi:hypothetical protein